MFVSLNNSHERRGFQSWNFNHSIFQNGNFNYSQSSLLFVLGEIFTEEHKWYFFCTNRRPFFPGTEGPKLQMRSQTKSLGPETLWSLQEIELVAARFHSCR